MERQSKCKKTLPPELVPFCWFQRWLPLSSSQPKTQGQTNERDNATADNIELMKSFKPVDESRKRVSAVIKINKETGKKGIYKNHHSGSTENLLTSKVREAVNTKPRSD